MVESSPGVNGQGSTRQRTDAEQIADALRIFISRGQVTELRALEVSPDGRWPHTEAGYFDSNHLDDMAEEAARLSKISKGVYFIPNPIKSATLARCANRVKVARQIQLTTDNCVMCREWLLIDADPVRPVADISATDDEKSAARAKVQEVKGFLEGVGWPAPVLADSGNGYHLLYPIELATEDDGLVKRILNALGDMFDTDRVQIDRKVFNPSRICKLYGTVSRKGDSTPDRPHRRAKILEGTRGDIVPQELLELVAGMGSPKAGAQTKQGRDAFTVHVPGERERRIRRARPYIAKMDAAIAGRRGHNQTFKVACRLILGFDLTVDEARPLLFEFNQRCQPPWTVKELEHKLADADKLPGPRGYLLTDGEQGKTAGGSTAAPETSAGTYTFRAIHSRAFAERVYPVHWLVQRLMVAGLATAVGAPAKSMKTSLMVDLAVSLGSGTPFLGKFKVYQKARCIVLSGETGDATIQETAKRICKARGIELGDTDVLWSFDLPQLASSEDIAELKRGLQENHVKVAVIDPLYLCLLAGVEAKDLQASNLFQLGPLLRAVAKACLEVGCTLIIVHHGKKEMAKNYEPMELSDFAFSGIPEFARQWLLLSRRERFEMSEAGAYHRLWLSAGGSVGHGGLWAVDINEGVLGDDFNGRMWEVSVRSAGEARQEEAKHGSSERQQQQDRKDREDDGAVLHALDELDPDRKGASWYRVQALARISEMRMERAVRRLVRDGIVKEKTVKAKRGNNSRVSARGLRRVPRGTSPDF
jgi:replicative DNA helicase